MKIKCSECYNEMEIDDSPSEEIIYISPCECQKPRCSQCSKILTVNEDVIYCEECHNNEIDTAREEGINDGYQDGYDTGREEIVETEEDEIARSLDAGYARGYAKGLDVGLKEAARNVNDEISNSFDDAYVKGYRKRLQDGTDSEKEDK